MIISKLDFLYRAQLDRETLQVWIEEEWLAPQGTAAEQEFSEAGTPCIRDRQTPHNPTSVVLGKF